MKNITVAQLIALLMNVAKGTFINMLTVTEVKMIKTGNPYFGRVFKVQNGNYLTGCSYQDRVNKNRKLEGLSTDFVAKPSSVGKHIAPVVLFNEKLNRYYFQYERFENSPLEVTYICDGQTIEKSVFEQYMPDYTNAYANQGVDKTVKSQSVTITNIEMITLDGVRYNIIKK